MELFSKLVVTEEKSLKMITKKFELSFFDFNRSEEHTSELQSQSNLVCRLLLEKKKKKYTKNSPHTLINRQSKTQITPKQKHTLSHHPIRSNNLHRERQ